MQKLIIVESPNKVAAIKKYLGQGYEVMASVGHVAYLPTTGKDGLGIDFENWEPLYKIDPTKKTIVKNLKEVANKSDLVLIATDPDREGEAIGQNLVDFLGVEKKYERIRYNEITKAAILRSIENSTKIDEHLVSAQKVRRMLDRIIGFKLSKLMKRKFSNAPTNPSAGRVQSIALKLTVDREAEIDAFVPENYFYVAAKLANDVEALLYLKSNVGDKNWIKPEDIDKIMSIVGTDLKVKEIQHSNRKDNKATPFKQAAFYKRSSLSASGSQKATQRLFEGFGDDGLITYPRTDSTMLSETFLKDAKKYIEKVYGPSYWDENVKGEAGDQNAHEAIRPTDLSLTPSLAAEKYKWENSSELYKTYKLIYQNTLKAIMTQPVRKITTFNFDNNGYQFNYSQSVITFDGYFKAIGMPEQKGINLEAKQNEIVKAQSIEKQAKATQPPARYNDGSLIEMLDNIKVGRPSTFSSTIKVIKDRKYVEKVNAQLIPTEFGKIVMKKLLDSFPTIINEDYTASIEQKLDAIADGFLEHEAIMNEFWNRFTDTLEFAYTDMEKTVLIPLFVGEKCPSCENELVYKKSRFGQFIGCAKFPDCNYARNVERQKNFNSSLARLKKAPEKKVE